MKNIKMIVLSVVVTGIVALAFAFKKPLGQGSIYCSNTCTISRIDFRTDPRGTITDPCENGLFKEYWWGGPNLECVEILDPDVRYVQTPQ